MANIKSVLVFLLVVVQSQCEDVQSASNNNTTTVSNTTSTTTTIAPTTTTIAPIIPTDNICKSCDCTPGLVDCHDKGIDKFFTIPDWSGVKDKKPTRVDLSLNKFTEVTPFPELSITVLDLSHGEIVSLKRASFKMLQSMVELDLSHNNITSAELRPDVFEGQYMPEEYQPLRSMRKLKLSYNSLHSLHQDLFEHLPELEELRLDGNPLTLLDHVTVVAISSLSYLKVLDLSNCQLKELPESSLHAPRKLEWLDLSSNEFQAVPSALGDSISLKYLSLSKNPIKYIERDSEVYKPFPKIASLRELHLSYMPKLESVKKTAMSGLENLEVLYMRHNPALSFIDPTALQRHDPDGEGQDWPQVKELYLDHNNLSVIDNGLIGRWDYLTTVDIQENPYLCDCTTQWMVDSLAEIVRKTSYNYTPDIICHEPIEMRGKSLIHLEDIHRHMRCSDKYGDRPERDAAILIGTLIGVLITIPTVLGLLLMYKRGYFAVCGAGGPAAFSRAFYKRAGTTDEFI